MQKRIGQVNRTQATVLPPAGIFTHAETISRENLVKECDRLRTENKQKEAKIVRLEEEVSFLKDQVRKLQEELKRLLSQTPVIFV